ncbi:MAG: LysR family transcriptional regulator [Leucobacter sp.]
MSEIRRLQTFLDFARLGTVAAVAEATQYSTSAVSQQLEKLAGEIGVPLVQPHGRLLKLTAAGETLAKEGPAVLDAWDRARSEALATTGEVRGAVAIAAFQSGCLALFPGLLAALRTEYPGMRVNCTQAEPDRAIVALRAREIDVAIVERYAGQHPEPHPDLTELHLGDDDMLLAVPAEWGPVTDLTQLAERPWVFEERGGPERAWAEALCHEAGFAPVVAHETSDVIVRCAMVASGAAAAFIPALTPEPLRLGAICTPLPRAQSRSLVALTRSSASADAAIAAVVQSLATVAVRTTAGSHGAGPHDAGERSGRAAEASREAR